MITTKVSETPIKDNPHKIDARLLYNKDNAQAVHMQIQPGESLKPHATPVDVFFFVLEGSPDILIGEEKMRIEANTLVDSPKNIVHCIYNNTQEIVRVLVVKAPKPMAKPKMV